MILIKHSDVLLEIWWERLHFSATTVTDDMAEAGKNNRHRSIPAERNHSQQLISQVLKLLLEIGTS